MFRSYMMVFFVSVIGCGGAVVNADKLIQEDAGTTEQVCKFPSNSYVVSYVELEGTCGPQADSLFDPRAALEPSCTRSTFFDPQTCQYSITESCKYGSCTSVNVASNEDAGTNYDADAGVAPTTNSVNDVGTGKTDTYEVSLLGGSSGTSGGNGVLTRTITHNDVPFCNGKYQVTFM
jgi:hypothetical protein